MKRLTSVLTALGAVLVTLGLFAAGFALCGMYPFGAKSLVWCDMEQQAVPLLMHLREIVRSGDSLIYSIFDAGGMNFTGVFCFFLCNPFSLSILWTDIPADMLMNLLVPMKLAIASGTAVIWLRYHERKLNPAFALILGVMYGCCGYGLFYYQNLMWLDVQAMFPLLMIAVDLLLYRKRTLPYVVMLSLMMILCFYLGYMLCIFMILYVVTTIWLILPKEQRGGAALRFCVGSIIVAIGTSISWLPSLMQVLASARSDSVLESLKNSEIFHAFADKLTLFGCSGICAAAILAVWCKNGMGKREAIQHGIMAGLLLFAAAFDPVNKMWHMGSYQAFPFRWAFIPILMLLTNTAGLLRSDKQADRPKGKWLLAIPIPLIAGLAGVVYWLLRTKRRDLQSYIRTLWVDYTSMLYLVIPIVLAVISYFVILLLFQKRKCPVPICAGMLAAVFACEFVLNFNCYVGGTADEDVLFAQTTAAAHQINDDDFYRVRMTKKYGHANMVGALGYPTLAHYTSLTRGDYLQGMKKFGYTSYWMEVSATGGTILSDAIWNVRYLLGQNGTFPTWSKEVWSDDLLTIRRNDLMLPPCVLTDAEPAQIEELPQGRRVDTQKLLAEQMLGTSDMIVEYPETMLDNLTLERDAESGLYHCSIVDRTKPAKIQYSFFVQDAQALYFDLYSLTSTKLSNPRNNAVNVFVNGKTAEKDYPKNAINGFLPLGDVMGQDVTVRVDVKKNFTCESLGVFGIRRDVLADACENAVGSSLSYDGDGNYSTECDADAPSLLILAVPYDEGFTAEVNGEQAEVFRVNSCETAVKVPSGHAAVKLHFMPRGLRIGMIGSSAAILLAVAWGIWQRKTRSEGCPMLRRISLVAVTIGFVGVVLAVYGLPLVIFLTGIF